MKQVVVVGGGASGLTAAIILARQGKQVTLIERNNICTRSLGVTNALDGGVKPHRFSQFSGDQTWLRSSTGG